MKPVRRLFGLLILMASLGLLAWGLWPAKTTKAAEAFLPGQMQLPPQPGGTGEGEGVQSAILPPAGVPENRSVSLEYPLSMREGDADVVMLTLEADDQGLAATAQFSGHTTNEGTVQIPNVYDTHSVQAEAQLDLPGASPNPLEPIVLSLLPGQKASFIWTIKPATAGTHRGVVRLFLRFTPLAGGEEIRQPLYARALEVNVVNLLGIGGQPARWMGLAGSVLGSYISVDDVIQWVFGRRKRDRRRKR